jgi:hypothetical protein
MNATQISTSLRWNLTTTAVLLAVTASAIWLWFSDQADSPAVDDTIGLLALALLACLPIGWLVRMVQWWRANRAPLEAASIRLWSSTRGVFRPSFVQYRIVWVEVEDADGRRWYQRVMWEPWLAQLKRKAYRVQGQRARLNGPMLFTTSHRGRIWSAGRARANPPRLAESLEPRSVPQGGSRWSTVAVLVIPSVVPAVVWGPVVGAVTWVYLISTCMFHGAAPVDRFIWR